jgi:hypothetical protein
MSKEEELLNIVLKYQHESSDAFQNLPSGLDWTEFENAMKPYDERLSEASRNYRMVQTPKFVDKVPDYGDKMSLKEFISCCKSGGFIDYDGSGEYIKNGKCSGINIYPSDVEHNKIREDFTKIVWYNK